MNKTEFITLLAKELETSKVKANESFEGMLKCITCAMKTNDILRFVDFGTFKAKKTKAREVTTPKGQIVKVPARRQIKFSAGTEFKKMVNGR